MAGITSARGWWGSADRPPPHSRWRSSRSRSSGVARRASLRPFTVTTPVQLDVTFKNYRPSELLSYLSVVKRTGSHSIRFTGRDIVEVSKFLEFMGDYQADLAP